MMVEEDAISMVIEGARKKRDPVLNLSHRDMKVIPADIAELEFVKTLLLNNNAILMPPEEVTHLSNLEYLSLEYNNITLLPSTMSSLSSTLIFLNLSHNPLTCVPPALGQLVNLKSLWLTNAQLISFPEELCSLCKLTHLSLEGNYISSIETPLRTLVKLQWLSLANNKIKIIGNAFSQLQLHTLHLSHNHLTEFPSLALSPSLSTLTLRSNKLSCLPENINMMLQPITKLDVRDNPLQRIPSFWTEQENILI